MNQQGSIQTPEANTPHDAGTPAISTASRPLRTKRAFLLWVGISVVLFLLLVGCLAMYRHFFRAPVPQTTSYRGPLDTITIGNVGEYSILNLIARDKGYFKQNGINAKVIEYASGPPAVADLLAKKNDFAVAADFVGVNSIASKSNVRILTELSQHSSFSVIARKDKGIQQPADLKGKHIGVTKKGAGEFFLGRFLNLHNLSVSDVNVVNLPPADLVSQISNGKLDAIVIFEPHVYELHKSLGSSVITWSAQGGYPTFALSYTIEETIKTKPDVVRRYIKSLAEAQGYLEHNQQAAKQLLAKDMHYDLAYVDYLWEKIDFRLALSQSLLSAMEDETRFVIQNTPGSQASIPNYLDYIYFDALTQESPDAVNIIH